MQQEYGGRRIGFGGLRLWVLLLFAGYAAFYWFSNRSTDALTGETVLIDKNIIDDAGGMSIVSEAR